MELDRFDPRVVIDNGQIPAVHYYEGLRVHSEMTYDRTRTNAFYRAVRRYAKGKVVLDIGTGIGTLSLFAAKEGAKKVYAIEATGIIDVAKKIISKNGYAKQIELIKGMSTEINLPERCDILVSELIGHFGVEEDIVEIFADARKRLLKPDAVLIPASLELFIVPVQMPEFENMLGRWNDVDGIYEELLGENYKKGIKIGELGTQYDKRCSYVVDKRRESMTDRFLAEPKKISYFDLYKDVSGNVAVDVKYTATRSGKMNGCVGWFKSSLTDDIEIGTSPASAPTHWHQVFFPSENLSVNNGDKIRVKFQYRKPENEKGFRFFVQASS